MGKIFDYDGVPVLHTTSGDLKGYFYGGVYIYKGIPYAYADRFQMPVPSKWNGVKDATNYGFVWPLQNQDKMCIRDREKTGYPETMRTAGTQKGNPNFPNLCLEHEQACL